MKSFKSIAFVLFFGLNWLFSTGQEKIPINEPNYNKSKLFEDLPQKMFLAVSDLEPLFDIALGAPVVAKLTPGFQFKGTIVSKTGDSKTLVRSVVIRSATRQGAALTFTKIINEDGSVVYGGRIISMESIDAYEIVKENDQYILQKKNYYEMVRE